MNGLGDLFTEFLFEYPFLWPLYAMGLWYFIIRPVLGEQAEPGEQQTFDRVAYNELLKPTKQAWLEAALDAFLPKARETGATFASLAKEFVLCSFVMTNKYFYFFGLDQSLLSNNYGIGKVAYSAIAKIDIKEGWVKKHITIHLSSGEVLLVKDLINDAPGRYLDLRLAEN